MNSKPIPVAGPWITDLEVEYVADAARNGWQSRAGEWQFRFETAFSQLVCTKHALCLPSCTSALHLSLAALGIGPGDEVIVPDLTWIATAAPVSYVGATPVFADCDPDTWCLTPQSVASCATERTRAIIGVDLYGSMPDYDSLLAFAADLGVPIIEDAAEGFGSSWQGAPAGSLGITGAFSFHGSKTMTTGEGGMLVTDDSALMDRIRFLADHGRIPGDVNFQNTEVAFKYKMSPIQAAMGLAQVERAADLVAQKRKIFSWYAKRLEGIDGIRLNSEPEGVINSYWMVTAVVAEDLRINKFEIKERLKAMDIDTRPFFSPLSSLKAYAGTHEADAARKHNSVSYAISNRGINLPSGLQLTENDVDRVCCALRAVLRQGGTA